MNKILFMLPLICFQINGNSQGALLRKCLQELFFEIPIQSTKYDVRKIIHSDKNFLDIFEYSNEDEDHIIVDFVDNFKLSYISDADKKTLCFSYIKGTDKVLSINIDLYYPDFKVTSCENQLNELLNFFKKLSYRMKNEPDKYKGEKVGEIYLFYSSEEKYNVDMPFLYINEKYYDNTYSEFKELKKHYYLRLKCYPLSFK